MKKETKSLNSQIHCTKVTSVNDKFGIKKLNLRIILTISTYKCMQFNLKISCTYNKRR